MRAVDAEAVQYGQPVRGQVEDRVGTLGKRARRAARVAMVVAEHPVTLRQAGDERVRPGEPGGVGAHDQEQRRRVAIARRVGPEADAGRRVDNALFVGPGGRMSHVSSPL